MKVPLVAVGLAACLLGGIGRGSADTVKLRNRPPFRNVAIADFRDDLLVIRGVSGEFLRKPLSEVEWFAVDEQPHLTDAERAAAAGNWAEALAAYEQALARPCRPWMRNLVRVRLLAACDAAGRFDLAVELYLELLRGQPNLATNRRPRRPGPVGSDTNARARHVLESHLSQGQPAAVATTVRSLLLELLIYEDVSALPAQLLPAASASAASRPVVGIGILPEAPPMAAPASRPSPPVVLGGDSMLIDAAERCLEDGRWSRAGRLLERGLPYVPQTECWLWRVLLGRCRMAAGEYAEAAAELIEVSETAPDHALAATALCYVALAHEHLGRTDVAARLYKELLARSETPSKIKERAREALARLPS